MTTPNFEAAINQLMLDEGGFVIDRGGPTNFGITLKYLQALNLQNPAFVATLDLYDNGEITINSIKNMTRDKATTIYQRCWWMPIYDQVVYFPIATKVFNISINTGQNAVYKCLQRAVRSASGIILLTDGDFGPNTLSAVNACKGEVLYAALKSEIAGYYRDLDMPTDENGWVKRAYE